MKKERETNIKHLLEREKNRWIQNSVIWIMSEVKQLGFVNSPLVSLSVRQEEKGGN